jgi:hypothetical protein
VRTVAVLLCSLPCFAQGKPSATEDGLALGLSWLAAHQAEDGRWSADHFMDRDPADDRCGGPGNPAYDTGLTGLALLAFLGADRDLPKNVEAGLAYLVRVQDAQGCFGPREDRRYLYNHAIATQAMCVAYRRTRDERWHAAAQKGLDFLASVRNPGLAWGYPPGSNDTSLTAWCVCALWSGKYAGLNVDPAGFEGARAWIRRMTDKETGRVYYMDGYHASAWRPRDLLDRFPIEHSEAMTAAGLFCSVLLGDDPRLSRGRAQAKLLVARPPTWNPDDGSIDFVYWYWGALATYQVGGEPRAVWERAMRQVLEHQNPKGAGKRTGSWDPIDPFGRDMGRVGSTALLTLCLEKPYERVFGFK